MGRIYLNIRPLRPSFSNLSRHLVALILKGFAKDVLDVQLVEGPSKVLAD